MGSGEAHGDPGGLRLCRGSLRGQEALGVTGVICRVIGGSSRSWENHGGVGGSPGVFSMLCLCQWQGDQ